MDVPTGAVIAGLLFPSAGTVAQAYHICKPTEDAPHEPIFVSTYVKNGQTMDYYALKVMHTEHLLTENI